MARKNPDKAKEVIRRLASEIRKYGDEGKQDLKDLFETHRPDLIFKLPPGPDRQARAAALVADMRNTATELTKSKYYRGKKTSEQVAGTHDRFRYIIEKTPEGKWRARITRQARQIIPHPDAPPIVDHPRLKKPFKSCEDAEDAIRRIINTSMFWYESRGITPKERVRKTKSARAGVRRRTAGQVAARAREHEKKQEEAERKRLSAQRAEERRRKKASKKQRRAKTPESRGGRKIVFVPRKNPSANPFSFSTSGSSAKRAADRAAAKYVEYAEEWQESLAERDPSFAKIMKAYDFVENARANYLLAEEPELAARMQEEKREIRKQIILIFKTCYRELESRRKKNPSHNPGKSEHAKIAKKHMAKAETAWKKYCDDCKVTDLLNAYKHLEIAREEFHHAGDTEAVAEAKEIIKQARAALRKLCKD